MSLYLFKASLSWHDSSCSPSDQLSAVLLRIAPLIRIDLLISGSPFDPIFRLLTVAIVARCLLFCQG